jgi:hypothetical protein
MKLWGREGIEFVPAIIYTVANGEDRVYFGHAARLIN